MQSIVVGGGSVRAVMDRIVITSNDKELIDAIWSFQIKDDPLEDWAAKLIGPHHLAELTIYLNEGASICGFVAVLFEFMEARMELKPSKTKTEIHRKQDDAELKRLVVSYQRRIDVELDG